MPRALAISSMRHVDDDVAVVAPVLGSRLRNSMVHVAAVTFDCEAQAPIARAPTGERGAPPPPPPPPGAAAATAAIAAAAAAGLRLRLHARVASR